MYQFLFRNKWAALAFLILMLVSVRALVGRQDEDGVISHTKTELIAQRKQMQQQMGQLNAAPSKNANIPPPPDAGGNGYVDDNDLIDDTKGFDPTPEIDAPMDPSPDQDDGY
jgi:hypothetical protein